MIDMLEVKYKSEPDLFIEMELYSLIKVEDLYKDGTSLKRLLRKGKGR